MTASISPEEILGPDYVHEPDPPEPLTLASDSWPKPTRPATWKDDRDA